MSFPRGTYPRPQRPRLHHLLLIGSKASKAPSETTNHKTTLKTVLISIINDFRSIRLNLNPLRMSSKVPNLFISVKTFNHEKSGRW